MRCAATAGSTVALPGPFHSVQRPGRAGRQGMNTYKIYKCVETAGTPRFRHIDPVVATVKGMEAAKAEALKMSRADPGTCYAVINPGGYWMKGWYTKPKVDPAPMIEAALNPLLPTDTQGTNFTSKWASLERGFPNVRGFRFVLDHVRCVAVHGKCSTDEVANDAIPTGAERLVFAMAKEIEDRVNQALGANGKLARAVKVWCKRTPTAFDVHNGEDAGWRSALMQVNLASPADDLGFCVVLDPVE